MTDPARPRAYSEEELAAMRRTIWPGANPIETCVERSRWLATLNATRAEHLDLLRRCEEIIEGVQEDERIEGSHRLSGHRGAPLTGVYVNREKLLADLRAALAERNQP